MEPSKAGVPMPICKSDLRQAATSDPAKDWPVLQNWPVLGQSQSGALALVGAEVRLQPVIHLLPPQAKPLPDPCTWPLCECAASCEAPNALRRRAVEQTQRAIDDADATGIF